ncbi:hypothetical protein PybrP1_008262 [[Pythium] brassicae (nom. inval.)]|nr:hypothetical protein PybrP1_008262 [[Pythium] brassicae (nom. inval.)]
MTPITTLLFLIPTLLSTAGTASAHDSIQLNLPTFAGSGCATPDDRVAVELSVDGAVLLVAFPRSFAASNDATVHARVACNGILPLTIPEGYAVGVSSDELRGAVAIPEEADMDAATHYAQVSSEVFFAPQRRGPRTKQRFEAPGASRFSIALPPATTTATTWSACGGPAALRLNTALVAHGRGASVRLGEDALRFSVRYKKCGGGGDSDVATNDGDNADDADYDNDRDDNDRIDDAQDVRPSVRRAKRNLIA